MARPGAERVASGDWCRGERVRVVEVDGERVTCEVLTGKWAGRLTTVSRAAVETDK